MSESLPASRDGLLVRWLPPLYALSALLALLVAPFWAWRWYQQPFLGVFLEPQLVVSQIAGPNWPGRDAGVVWSDRLVAVGGVRVNAPSELRSLTANLGYAPISLEFVRRSGEHYHVTLTPRPVRPDELVAQFIIPYGVGLILAAAGWWAYFLGGGKRAPRAFLMFVSAAAILTGTFLDMNTSHYFLVGWCLSLPICGAALLNLALVFPQPSRLVARLPAARLLPWAVAAVLSAWILRDLYWPPSSYAYILSWRWSYIFIALSMILFLALQLWRFFRPQGAMMRQQARVIIFGALIAFGPLLLLYLVPSALGQAPMFQTALYVPPLVALPLAVAYAIARYRLLDIDRVLGTLLAYGLTIILGVGTFYGVLAGLSYFLHEGLKPDHPLVVAVYLFLLVVLLNPAYRLMRQGIDRVFYRQRGDQRSLLTDLARRLVVTPHLGYTQRLLERTIYAALTPRGVYLYLYDEQPEQYLVVGEPPFPAAPLAVDSPLVRQLARQGQTILLLPDDPHPLAEAERAAGDVLSQARVFVPLRYERRLIGFLALGDRRSGEPYTSDDLEFLDGVAGQSALALENARLFTNLQHTLDMTLEMKDLMDEVFTSIASGVITCDRQGIVTLCNPAAERILATPAAALLGQPLEAALPGIGLEAARLAHAAIAENQITLGEELEPRLPGRGALWLRLSCAPLRAAHGPAKGAALLIDDLSTQRALQLEQERIRQTLGRVVAPQVRERLLNDPRSLHLEGERQPITVLFADMSQFTHYSEHAQPETLLRVLNTYLALAANAILAEEGTLDKFIGDAVMAFWNAPDRQPDHAVRAVRAALAMQRAFAAQRERSPQDEQMHFTLGLATGEAMVGNIGTAQLFNYTVIGDTVNLAQRMETIAAPDQILLTEPLVQAVTAAVGERLTARRLNNVRVKGRTQEVVVYELLGLDPGQV